MSTHNICFRLEIRKILFGYLLLSVAMVTKVFELLKFDCTLYRTNICLFKVHHRSR